MCRRFFPLLVCCLFTHSLDSFADVGSGMVASWSFNGNLSDATGNTRDGTPIGTAFGPDRFGRQAQACWFNGTSDYVVVSDTASLQLTNQISILAWVYWQGGGSWNPRMISYGANFPSDYRGFEFLTLGNGADRKLMFIWGDQYMESIKNVAGHEWRFVAAVGNSNSLAIYVDGNLDSAVMIPRPHFNYGASPMGIGRKSPAVENLTDDLWGGGIDELRVFDRALSSEEIRWHYKRDISPLLKIGKQPESEGATVICSSLVIKRQYVIESSPDLVNWIAFGPQFTASSNVEQKQVPMGAQRNFWRLKLVP